MAKVKIFLDRGETQRDAEDQLLKALTLHSSGEVHQDSFEDPAMDHVIQRADEIFKKISEDMFQEINETLEQDFLKPYGN